MVLLLLFFYTTIIIVFFLLGLNVVVFYILRVYKVVSKSIVTLRVVSRNVFSVVVVVRLKVVIGDVVFFFALVLFLEIVERARKEFTFTASLLGDAIERVFEFAPSRNWFLFTTTIVLRPRRGGVEVHLVFALVFYIVVFYIVVF